jgi:hypothetical protein
MPCMVHGNEAFQLLVIVSHAELLWGQPWRWRLAVTLRYEGFKLLRPA